jgi:ribosomal protein L29
MTTFKNTSEADLKKLVADKKDALRSSRFGVAGSRARNVKEARTTRREIARALTELRARVLGLAKEGSVK